jgi:hypothetical protein
MTRLLLLALLALASPSYAATVTTPGSVTINPLDISTVTTGGTAVQAINPGHRSAGGWIQNPSTATISLCVNELAAAVGTTSSGSLTCLTPGQSYVLAPNPGSVSVISSDSSHPFSGQGWQ